MSARIYYVRYQTEQRAGFRVVVAADQGEALSHARRQVLCDGPAENIKLRVERSLEVA